MSFPPGVPLPMTRTLYATSTVPSGAMMVQMAPVRPVTMVPVSQVVVRPMMRPVISQSQAAFMRTMQPQTLTQVVTNHAVLQAAGQQVWIQSAEPAKSAIIAKPPELKKDVLANSSRSAETSTEPAITVFVGNITDRASDTLVRQLLMKCGSVFSWKRVQGPSGKLQAFGFCEYKDPESALRAIHILHEYMLGDKKLLVKVDAKTQELIDNWKKEKGMETDDSSKLAGVKDAQSGIEALVQGYSNELTAPKAPAVEKPNVAQILKPDPAVRDSSNIEENLDELQLEEEKKNFISKEIRTFRESQKQQEERLRLFKAEREKVRSREMMLRERSRLSRAEREERSRRTRSPRNRRSRSISPVRRSPRRRSRTPPRALLVRRISPRRTPPRRRSRSPPPRRRRSSSRSPSWRRDDDDESEREEERRRIEKRIKEKEAAYQERLRNYEAREKRRKRFYEKLAQDEATEREEKVKEAKKFREFLADYDDDKDDSLYFEGVALSKKLNDREVEIEEDEKERKREVEELGMLRRRLVEENHTDPDAVMTKVLAETENVWKPFLEPDTPPRDFSPHTRASSSSSVGSASDSDTERSYSDSSSESSSSDDQSVEYETEIVSTDPSNHVETNNHQRIYDVKIEPDMKIDRRSSSIENQQESKKRYPNPVPLTGFSFEGFSPSNSNNSSSPQNAWKSRKIKQEQASSLHTKRRKLTVSEVFNQDDEEEFLPKKKKILPLYLLNEDKRQDGKPAADRKKLVRALIERIPTEKEHLFAFNLDWSVVDSVLMDKRIKPWITKKIVEYIGEDEPTLVEFICSKILSKSSATKILEDISMVLDEEADIFVAKLWRLLIYETEAKKEGLSKT